MKRKKLVRPYLFSQVFKGSAADLDKAGLFDPVLNSDSKLFIDPLLLEGSDNPHMVAAYKQLREHFTKVTKLLSASRGINDPAWKAARRILDLGERSETCLGYGGSSISGSSRSQEVKERILETTKQIIELGEDNPEIISLMGMFEEGVGPDTISDLTTFAILPALCALTDEFCKKSGVPVRRFNDYWNAELPENPIDPSKPILLVPQDILRDLPLAADWSDVARVTLENEKIRDAFNSFVGLISEATLTEKKEAIKRTALLSLDHFRAILYAVLGSSDSYDPKADPLNLYRFREMIAGDLSVFTQPGLNVGKPSSAELQRLVLIIVEHFKTLVENNNLWELLWHEDKPKREKAAQLIFFAVADTFCKANNIDISPETNPGGGPVDFRFSKGYTNRVLVEIKLSKGKVVQGYKTQIGIYQGASNTDSAIFLLINVGKMGQKLVEIQKHRDTQIEAGLATPEIIVVDGRRKRSASVRETLFEVIEDDFNDDDDEE
ncbi:hypothetical protein [Rhizobium binxianense]|uniref:hypothetical protein n=1 Tax=Rhizobium binxianense TaxID=3024242 RepID=UPI0023626C3C|nr:hypothetical protein [Rhizobium sp. MJ37]